MILRAVFARILNTIYETILALHTSDLAGAREAGSVGVGEAIVL